MSDVDGRRKLNEMLHLGPYISRFVNPQTGTSWPVPDTARKLAPAPIPPPPTFEPPAFDGTGWFNTLAISAPIPGPSIIGWAIAYKFNVAAGTIGVEVTQGSMAWGKGTIWELAGADGITDPGVTDTHSIGAFGGFDPASFYSSTVLSLSAAAPPNAFFAFLGATLGSQWSGQQAILSPNGPGWAPMSEVSLAQAALYGRFGSAPPGATLTSVPTIGFGMTAVSYSEAARLFTGSVHPVTILQNVPANAPGITYLRQPTRAGSALVFIAPFEDPTGTFVYSVLSA